MTERNEERGVSIRPSRSMRSFRDLWEDMDRMWEGFPSMFRMGPLAGGQAWPAVDVFERDNSVVVKADIPGMSPENIDITVSEDSVTIAGERTEEKEVKEKDFYRSERSYGRFTRHVPLPTGADGEQAQATFKDGVLEVVFPLKEGSRQKKIDIKAA